MILQKIALTNFRSYVSCEVAPSPKLNLIYGSNGSGKTNLAEAIHFLSLAKSWRTNEAEALIRNGNEEAFISARIESEGIAKKIEVAIGKRGKRIAINGKSVRRLSELSKIVNVIVFSPEDVSIFKGAPSERRSFLDISISKRSLDYFSLIGRFNKLLEERNAVLKQNVVDRDYLDVVTERLIEIQEPIERYRRAYVGELNKILSGLASRLYGEKRTLSVDYRPFIKGEDDFKTKAKRVYERSLESDIYHKSTSQGIHREDFSCLLDGKDISLFGSQGENRLGSIALKISPFFLIEDEGEKPIVVLDDTFSELDAQHSENLLNIISDMGQVFVTTTNKTLPCDCAIEVSDNKAIRRK